MKTYYSNVPFVTIQVMRGPGVCEAFQFRGGVLTTDDADVLKQLDQAVDKYGSGITSIPVGGISLEEKLVADDVRKAAEIAHAKMVAAGEKTA
jgi:hypothetical protein